MDCLAPANDNCTAIDLDVRFPAGFADFSGKVCR
jgi:hypothetical protein